MPLLSAFTPLGFLSLSSRPTYAQVFYKQLVQALSKAFDMSRGTRMEAFAYALSMALARAKYALDRAGNQARPLSAYDLIPLLEQGYLVVPSPGASVSERAATLAAIDALQIGGRFWDISSQLQTQLGSSFLGLVRTKDITTPTVYPAAPGSAQGNFVDPRTPALFLQLVDPLPSPTVPLVGARAWVAYEDLDTSEAVTQTWVAGATFAVGATIIPLASNGYVYQCTQAGTTGSSEPVFPTALQSTVTDGGVIWTCSATIAPLLTVGQTVTVQGENTAQAEKVTVLGVSLTPQGQASAGPCFEAIFYKAHDIGSIVVTGVFPYWFSTQRELLVVTTAAAAANRETRRQVDELMRKSSRVVDTWATVAATTQTNTGGTIGPMTVGSPMGTQTVGSFNFIGAP